MALDISPALALLSTKLGVLGCWTGLLALWSTRPTPTAPHSTLHFKRSQLKLSNPPPSSTLAHPHSSNTLLTVNLLLHLQLLHSSTPPPIPPLTLLPTLLNLPHPPSHSPLPINSTTCSHTPTTSTSISLDPSPVAILERYDCVLDRPFLCKIHITPL